MSITDSEVELILVMGADATHDFFAATELPPEVVKVIVPVPPRTPFPLPLEIAPRLFEVSADGRLLVPSKVTVATDGLETIFDLHFPRPAGTTLDVRATYFNGIESIKGGAFVALDENSNGLGAALLSRKGATVQVPLPVKPSVETNTQVAVEMETNSVPSTATESEASSQSEIPQPSFVEFLRLGIEHILKGFDHLLFLCALLIGVRKVKPMLWIITCFTLAHSVTLALSALNLVTFSSRIVEPLIALSIIVVAIENIVREEAASDRYWMAGGFGLIHGFGFASVLRETGLAQPGMALIKPLFSFNLGVELGQLAVVVVVVPLLFALRRWPTFVRYGAPAVSVLVILLSGYWFLERTVFYH